jgi:hypothetical protein
MTDDCIRSFRIEILQAEIDYLHDRLRNAPLARRTARRGVDPRQTAGVPDRTRRVLAHALRLARPAATSAAACPARSPAWTATM